MDLLRQLVGHRGQWCATVSHECDLSSHQPGLETIVEAHEIFGEPLVPETGQEHIDTQAIRTSFARPGEPKTKHLGEAETIAIILNRNIVAAFITDDESAARRARREGIVTYTTWHILKLAVKTRLVTVEEAWQHVIDLEGHKRRHPFLKEQDLFFMWCGE